MFLLIFNHLGPYFSSRAAVRLCQLILVPYNILLHRPTREAWGLDLSEAVIIIDEAHNLLQTVASMYSVYRFLLSVLQGK